MSSVEEWDAEAAGFDEPADHGLHDPEVRERWRALLIEALPPPPARVADLGCGTGTLSVLLAEEGFVVDGVDFSPEMVALALAKVAAHDRVSVVRGDAYLPPLARGAYDVALCRHVLWAMPDPAVALTRWVHLLRPAGRLVLVEGRWSDQAGLSAEETVALVEGAGLRPHLTRLPHAAYWGREIDDDRYLVVGERP